MQRRRSTSVGSAPNPKKLEVPLRKISTSSPFTRRRKKSSISTDVRIAFVGTLGVGKSALTVRFLTRRFIGEYENSADYKYRHMISLGDEIIHLEILDARSQNVLSNDVIRWADGVCLVYSITDLSSFWTIRTWAHKIRECRKNSVCEFILVGNKKDLSHFRKISTENGRALASELECPFFEVSAAEDYQSICDALYELYQENDMSGVLVSLDFHKAFDSVDHRFIIEALKSFNFGESFINWVKMFYEDVTACVMNHGISTGYFEVGRGVRQGDPLSPYLLIVAIELLAITTIASAMRAFQFQTLHRYLPVNAKLFE
ncbi:ras-related and estrogen-regulated growth inhibitor-like [Saccoglossus kowalevskii]